MSETRLKSMGKFREVGTHQIYEQTKDPVTGRWKWTHLLVAEAVYGPILKGYCVHHKNGEKLDNRPENLDVMPITEHWALHTYGNRELGVGKERLRVIRAAEVFATDEWKRAQSERGRKSMTAYNARPGVKEMIAKRQSEWAREYWSRPGVKEKHSAINREVFSRPEVKSAHLEKMKSSEWKEAVSRGQRRRWEKYFSAVSAKAA